MLRWRLAVSAVLIPLLIAIFSLDHQAGSTAPFLLGLCCLLAVRGNWELVELLKKRSLPVSYPMTVLGSTAVVMSAWWGQWAFRSFTSLETVMLTFSMVVLLIFFKGCVLYREPGKNVERMACEIFCVTYIGVLLAVTAQLRWLGNGKAGYLALASVVIAAKSGDIGGYTLGRLFGKKKLVPLLSPGKTWMGALGAVLGASLGSWLWLHFGPSLFSNAWAPCDAEWALCYGAIMGVIGLIGDLAESLIKRDVGAKDSSNLVPGFGGLLDLLDSVLYSGPVALVLWHALPLAEWVSVRH